MSLKTVSTRGSRAIVLAVLLAIAGGAFLASCSRQGKTDQTAQRASRPTLVTVAASRIQQVPVQLTDLIGTVQATHSVTVRSEVDGKLVAAPVKKGQYVQAGQLLFQIDPEPYKLALELAQAAYAKDKPQADFAANTNARYQQLVPKSEVGTVEADQIQANAAEAAANLKVDQAAIDNAELQLRRTEIHSPIGGRVGDLMIDPGNLVKANDTALITVNQVKPIEVFFPIPQASLPQIQARMAKGNLKVEAFIGDSTEPEIGELMFIDNAADAQSLTIRLGATFANDDERLWPPGQYVKVNVLLDTRDSVTVPARAVQTGREGHYVFVVQGPGGDPPAAATGADVHKGVATVEQRTVTLGPLTGDEIVIQSGLKGDEVVVTDGQFQLMNGSKVQIKPEGQGAAGPASAPATGEALR